MENMGAVKNPAYVDSGIEGLVAYGTSRLRTLRTAPKDQFALLQETLANDATLSHA